MSKASYVKRFLAVKRFLRCTDSPLSSMNGLTIARTLLAPPVTPGVTGGTGQETERPIALPVQSLTHNEGSQSMPNEIAPGVAANPKERAHKATYSSDKRNGGWLVRVHGATPERFAGRTVPVTMRDGSEHLEKLVRLVWKGADQESGTPVALYTFEPKPREEETTQF